MKAVVSLVAVVVVWGTAPGPCFALWGVHQVTPDGAKDLGLEVRSTAAGPDAVRIELEFKTEGALKGFSRVDLRIDEGATSLVTAPLEVDRSRPGRAVVGFAVARASLDRVRLWVMVPESLGGTAYDVRVKDFVEAKKAR
jgi:hypothetical protein